MYFSQWMSAGQKTMSEPIHRRSQSLKSCDLMHPSQRGVCVLLIYGKRNDDRFVELVRSDKICAFLHSILQLILS